MLCRWVLAAFLAASAGAAASPARSGAPAAHTPAAAPTAYLEQALREMSSAEAAAAAAPVERPGRVLLRVVLDLLLVLALLVGFLLLLRLFLRRRPMAAQTSGHVRILEVAHLAPKKAVYLVEIADRVLVIGSAGESLSLLAEIREPDALERLRAGGEPGGEGFLSVLTGFAKRLPSPGARREPGGPPA